MAEHPIQGLMKTAMENLKEMVDVNTIVGDPVETPDGSVILPVSKVGFGFAAGGSEFEIDHDSPSTTATTAGEQTHEHPFGGGSGGGVSITPVAFLVVNANNIRMIHIDGQTHLYEKIMDAAPQVVEKIQSMINKNKNKQQTPKVPTDQMPTSDELGL